MDFPYGIMVTVQRRQEDPFGDFSTVSEHEVGPCAIDLDPRHRVENIDVDLSAVKRISILYAPWDSDIKYQDRIVAEIGPDVFYFLVTSDVTRYTNPFTGWKPACTVRMEGVTG